MVGYESAALVGQSISLLLPEHLRSDAVAHSAFLEVSGAPMGRGHGLSIQRRDGVEIPVEVTVSFAPDEPRGDVIAYVTDLTSRQQLELERTKAVIDASRAFADEIEDPPELANTIARTATREGALANWRAWLHAHPGHPKLVQFCHGAPGFVACLADFPDASLDDLLVAAGETTWHAGPLTKGSNICHGTGGNGYAFLKLFRRTGEALWLERARAFAMHAAAQVERLRTKFGCGRHSLWTGDAGTAVYLWSCIREDAAFPTVDFF